MIDLTKCKVNPFRTYDGSNGNEILDQVMKIAEQIKTERNK